MPAPRSAFPALQLALFGGVTIQVHGERVTDLPTRKAEALLIYVVCNPHPHQRETLAELFWDDLPADRATANVRLALNHLRKRFEPFLEITPTTVAIRLDIDCWVDVQVFARALAAQPREAEPLAEALNLYRGDFLEGFHLRSARGFSEWQDAQSIRWRQQALEWMHTLVERYTTRSAYSEGSPGRPGCSTSTRLTRRRTAR
jgi:DNA-binding SARP family transcriptional activator